MRLGNNFVFFRISKLGTVYFCTEKKTKTKQKTNVFPVSNIWISWVRVNNIFWEPRLVKFCCLTSWFIFLPNSDGCTRLVVFFFFVFLTPEMYLWIICDRFKGNDQMPVIFFLSLSLSLSLSLFSPNIS